MKISQMLQREDFYAINEKTLSSYFEGNSEKNTCFYIYPQLNAIVSQRPSKAVVDYLLCEYSVRGSKAKQLAIQAYVFGCMKSRGILSSKKCTIRSEENHSLLIYPCNKKYRIFDFSQNTVAVTAKSGFNDSDLQHEINFRRREDLPDFVPRFISSDKRGYKERIIDGRPLARITSGFEALRDQAYALLLQYGASQQKTVSARAYAQSLQEQIFQLLKQKATNVDTVEQILKKLMVLTDTDASVTLTFSHGDLQAGNIWVENGTGKIYIIDWESWGIRSIWYDYATLYQRLRPGDIGGFLTERSADLECAIVLSEDLIFHLHELNSLPEEFGKEQFREYCEGIAKWMEIGE